MKESRTMKGVMFFYEGKFKNILTDLDLTASEEVTIMELLNARCNVQTMVPPWHEEDVSYDAKILASLEMVIVHYVGEERGAKIFLSYDGKKPKAKVIKKKITGKKAVKKKG